MASVYPGPSARCTRMAQPMVRVIASSTSGEHAGLVLLSMISERRIRALRGFASCSSWSHCPAAECGYVDPLSICYELNLPVQISPHDLCANGPITVDHFLQRMSVRVSAAAADQDHAGLEFVD